MKRVLSMLLLLVFTFNLGGYYVLFKVLQANAHNQLIHRLDNDEYDVGELVELRIPINLPYPSFFDNAEYKRVNGKIEFKGNIYKLVRQKLDRDVMIVQAIKDNDEKRLLNNFKEFERSTQDAPISNKSQSTQTLKQLQKEYHSLTWQSESIVLSIPATNSYPVDVKLLAMMRQDVPTPPPQS